MRTPQAVRISAFSAYLIALVAGFFASYSVHLIFGGGGRGGFVDLNVGGIFEILAFVLVFSNVLLWMRQAFKLPISTLLSCGIDAPPPAKQFATKLPEVSPSTLELSQGLAVLRDGGRAVGLFDALRDRTLEWQAVPKASGDIAVTELRELLANSPFVVIADGDVVHGAITQEMFIHGFWRGGISK
jgi:hypothetical protein